MVEINYFREFVVLAKTRSYLESAEQLFLSQSTLSKHIKKFELELGHTLFLRTTRKVELTSFGKKFLPFAEQIAQIQNEYTEQLLNIDPEETTISIGITTALFEHFLANVIQGFENNFPEYQVVLSDQDMPQLKQHLTEKKFDFVFIHDVVENDSEVYIKELIEIDNLAAVFPQEHPLAGKESVALSELKDAQFLFLPEGTVVHNLALNECRKNGFEPSIKFTSPSCENIFHLVEKGYGIGIVAQNHLPPHDNVRLVDIVPHIPTAVSICFRKDPLSLAAKGFLDWVRDFCSNSNKK